jgi:hypothetical protein
MTSLTTAFLPTTENMMPQDASVIQQNNRAITILPAELAIRSKLDATVMKLQHE